MRSALSHLRALGPELAIYILTAPLLAGGAHAATAQSASPVTNLDLSQLGRVAVGGDFDSISLYAYDGQNENTSTNGSESLLTRYPDGAFQSLALADADASITAMCSYVADGDLKGVVIGGNFTSLGGVAASSVALWNPSSNEVTALPGLSGPVNALYCDDTTGTVYVGGNFMGGSSTNAMAWAEGWINLPFAGFNGPVQSIDKNTAGHIVFGGQFDGLGNATSPEVADQQVVNLGGGTITAAGSTDTAGFSDPSNIICKTGESDGSGNTWLLADNRGGYWDGTYGFGFIPTKMRLYNTAQDGRGTKTFYFEEMNSGGILNLTYVDPTTGQNASCIQRCPLPENNSTAQDFHFVAPVGMSHFRIFITEWYGSGAGLSGIEMFQDDIFSYAVNAFNEPMCDSVSNGSSSTASPADLWTRAPNNGQTAADFLSATLTEASQVTSDTNVVFTPNIRQSGNYSVMVYTPGCILDNSCSTRGQVNMTATTSSDSEPVSTTLFQTNNYDKFDQVYYGYIDADADSFRPTVTLAPVSGQSVPLNVVASRVRFELITTTGGLNGLYEYNPNEATTNTDFSTSAINSAGSSLESHAQVNAVVQGSSAFYVGGDFTGNGIANIMAVDKNVTALPAGGLDGPVLDMHLNGSQLYIGGSFNDTSDSSTGGLNNVAVYSTEDNAWSALGAGVNGAVFSIIPLQLNISSGDLQSVFTITGNFTSVNAYGGHEAFDADGFAVWVPGQTTWLNNIASANVALGGELTSYTEVPDNSPLYGGSITSQGLDYSSAVELVGSGSGLPSLQSIGIQLEQSSHAVDSSSSNKRKRALIGETSGQNYTGVYDGLFYGENGLNITVLGGSFSATPSNGSAMENLVFVNYTNTDKTVSGVSGLDNDSIFVAMDTQGTQLWAGGAVNGTVNGNQATGLIVYDLATSDFVSPHPPALAGDNVVVNAISAQPSSTSVYVGGDFDTAGSLPCGALCSYDTDAQAWQTTGTGLRGTINAMLWSSNTKLMIAGNLTIAGNATTLATYDTKEQTFEAYTGADTLPGPIVAITAVNSQYTEFWAGGVSTSDNSAFLSRYSDGNWTSATGLGAATTIRKLQIMPLSSNHDDSDLMSNNQVLMILGNVNIPDVGNASAVLYNGTHYEPFILTSMDDGSQGSLSAVFVSNPQNFITHNSHHLALGLVVVIGLAIALGIIFLLVCAGILLERRRRRLEGYVPMTADKSSNIARLPPEALFSNMESKGSPPKL